MRSHTHEFFVFFLIIIFFNGYLIVHTSTGIYSGIYIRISSILEPVLLRQGAIQHSSLKYTIGAQHLPNESINSPWRQQ